MSLTYLEVKEAKTRTKYYSEADNIVLTRTEIMKRIRDNQYFYDSSQETFDDFVMRHFIPCDLEELKKVTFMRDGQVHNLDCEFASGRSCHCWCGEKYHGLNGKGAQLRK